MNGRDRPRIPWNLSYEPLARLCGPQAGPAEISIRVGVTRRAVNRWKLEGISAPAADRAATALGRHPREVWGSFAYELAEDFHHLAMLRGRARASWANQQRANTHVVWEPNDRFCGRRLSDPGGRPHTCATDGCRCEQNLGCPTYETPVVVPTLNASTDDIGDAV